MFIRFLNNPFNINLKVILLSRTDQILLEAIYILITTFLKPYKHKLSMAILKLQFGMIYR